MDQGTLVASAALVAVAVAALVLVAVLVRRGRRADRERGRLVQELDGARARLETMHARLDSLEAQASRQARQTPEAGAPGTPGTPDTADFVITTARTPESARATRADHHGDVTVRETPLTSRQFVSVAVGESLVTLVSLGHGVRRALSAENRNRIGFEVKREVRRSRKERRREVKEARRHLRAAQRDEAA